MDVDETVEKLEAWLEKAWPESKRKRKIYFSEYRTINAITNQIKNNDDPIVQDIVKGVVKSLDGLRHQNSIYQKEGNLEGLSQIKEARDILEYYAYQKPYSP